MTRLLLVAVIFLGSACHALASSFAEAQSAAHAGEYHEVIAILTGILGREDLTTRQQVIAYANRGIAHSLLGTYERAREDLEAAHALDPDHGLTLNHLGIIAEHVDENARRAFRWYQRAAEQGFAGGKVNAANLLLAGKGVRRDVSEARRLLESAASDNYAMAWTPLAKLLLDDAETVEEREAAMALLLKADAAGVVEAGYHLGRAYLTGTGVMADPGKAAGFLEKAALNGHTESQNALGYLYRRGVGVEQNYEEAVKWYRLATDQGNLQAANRLAWLLATCPVPEVCNGPVAVEVALSVVKLQRTASTLDSLAAAHARAGDYDEAIKIIEALLREFGKGGERYADRLERYQLGIPYQL